ncbi:STAS domain-containing protein [Streptomyces sp. A5-4]|uniref:STAS domain-containing protein n=1 Tax=Streptomyces sp. A5-4 TaxID=3384771 RepID=UPI003DA9BDD9
MQIWAITYTHHPIALILRLPLRASQAFPSRGSFPQQSGTCRQAGDAWLIVDLSQVLFMDSTAVRELCTAQDRYEQAGCGLRLVYDQPSIGRLLAFHDATLRFPRYASAKDARAGSPAPPTTEA